MREIVLSGAFVVLWFLALFCLLPIGLGDPDPETGAPSRPRILLKMGAATVIAAVLWAGFYLMVRSGMVAL